MDVKLIGGLSATSIQNPPAPRLPAVISPHSTHARCQQSCSLTVISPDVSNNYNLPLTAILRSHHNHAPSQQSCPVPAIVPDPSNHSLNQQSCPIPAIMRHPSNHSSCQETCAITAIIHAGPSNHSLCQQTCPVKYSDGKDKRNRSNTIPLWSKLGSQCCRILPTSPPATLLKVMVRKPGTRARSLTGGGSGYVTGMIIYPNAGMAIDLVWRNIEAKNRIIKCQVAEKNDHTSDHLSTETIIATQIETPRLSSSCNYATTNWQELNDELK